MRIPFHNIPIEKIKTGESRFWAKVEKGDGCWNWNGSVNSPKEPYGKLAFMMGKQINLTAHRVSWMLHFGEIPEGMCVLHKCDNPACVRPDHLFLGTDADNNLDKLRKGRANAINGEKVNTAKMTPLSVRVARRLFKYHKFKLIEISAIFGISVAAVWSLVMGKSWKHVPMP